MGHLVGDRAVVVAAERLAQRLGASRPRRDGRREKAFLRTLMPPQRIFHPPERQPLLLDRMNQRFQGRRLGVVVAAADEDPVTTGFNGQNSRSRDPSRHSAVPRSFHPLPESTWPSL